MVIRVTKSGMQKNKKQKIVVIVEGYELVTRQVSAQVGSPISYEEYIKNGKNNPDGDNLVKIVKGAQQTKRESKSADHEPFEESKSNVEDIRLNKEPAKIAQKVNPNPNSNTNSRLPSNATSNINSKQNPPAKEADRRVNSLPKERPVESKPKPGPIEKMQPRR